MPVEQSKTVQSLEASSGDSGVTQCIWTIYSTRNSEGISAAYANPEVLIGCISRKRIILDFTNNCNVVLDPLQ